VGRRGVEEVGGANEGEGEREEREGGIGGGGWWGQVVW